MAKTEPKYLIAASFTGLAGLALLIASFASDYWITADIQANNTPNTNTGGSANYGLFTGTLNRPNLGTTQTYTIHATCLISENVCAWSCLTTDKERQAEVETLYHNGSSAFNCNSYQRSSLYLIRAGQQVDPNNFMSAGLWASTIAFLSLAVLMNTVGVIFNLFNVLSNPIELYASIRFVIIYYTLAAFATTMTLILWGSQYGIHIIENIAILDTLTKTLSSQASLGWSYYLLVIADFEQLLSIGFLIYRSYKFRRQEANQVIKTDDKSNDASTFLY